MSPQPPRRPGPRRAWWVAGATVVALGAASITAGLLVRPATIPDHSAAPVRSAVPPSATGTPDEAAADEAAPDAPATLPGATRPGTRPPVVDHGPREGSLVALTFDADMTEGTRRQLRSGQVRSFANLTVVDLLEREEVPATFFLTGMWVEEYPELTRWPT